MTDEKARTAGVRKEDRLSAGLDSKQIIEKTKTSELASTARVYRKEWVFDSRHVTQSEAEAYVEQKYVGRLRPDDMEVKSDPDNGQWVLWTRKWNVTAEFKDLQRAEEYAKALEGETEVVTRNSRREHLLSQYGILRLTPSS